MTPEWPSRRKLKYKKHRHGYIKEEQERKRAIERNRQASGRLRSETFKLLTTLDEHFPPDAAADLKEKTADVIAGLRTGLYNTLHPDTQKNSRKGAGDEIFYDEDGNRIVPPRRFQYPSKNNT